MLKTKRLILILIFVFLSLTACTPPVKEIKKVEVKPAPKIVVQPIEVKAPKPDVDAPVQQDVLILLSSSAKIYQKIAEHLMGALGERAVQIILSGLPAQDRAMMEDIKASSTQQIVAVGLKAALAAKNFEDKKIIYTQVMTHEKFQAENIKGVSSLPSPEKLFSDWKKLSPKLSKVAIISGDNLEGYLKRAKVAAKKNGIKLVVELVKSDKGFIYKSKKFKPDVGGQWILPDNRILSGKALKEVMAYSSRRGRQIVVFSPKLLSFGGFFYVSPNLEMIAAGVLQRLSDSAGKKFIPGMSVLPIMDHTMGINQNIARQLNLTIPNAYRKYIHAN